MTIPNIWRTKGERYQLRGAVCNTCSTPLFPTRHTCPSCSKVTNSSQTSESSPAKLVTAKRQYAMPIGQSTEVLASVGDD